MEPRKTVTNEVGTNEVRIVAATCVGHAVCHLGMLIFAGVLVELRREFQLSEFQVTLVPLLGYILMGVGAIPAGLITDRWSPQGMLVVYFAGMAAACGVITVARDVWMVITGLTLLGAAASLYHPAGLTMISHGVRLRGRAMGIHGVAGSIGIALGPSVGLWMAAWGVWRGAYAAVGLVALLAAVAVARAHIHDPKEIAGENARPAAEGRTDGRGPLARMLPLLYLVMLCGGVAYRALVTTLPTFLLGSAAAVEAGLRKGGWASLGVLIIGGVGQLIGGRLSDGKRPARLYALLTAAAIAPAIVLSFGYSSFAIIFAAILTFFSFSVQPVENNLLARASPARHRATLYGLKFAPSFGVGAVGAPAVGMLWKTTGSLASVFVLIALLMAVMAGLAAIVALKEGGPRRRGLD